MLLSAPEGSSRRARRRTAGARRGLDGDAGGGSGAERGGGLERAVVEEVRVAARELGAREAAVAVGVELDEQVARLDERGRHRLEQFRVAERGQLDRREALGRRVAHGLDRAEEHVDVRVARRLRRRTRTRARCAAARARPRRRPPRASRPPASRPRPRPRRPLARRPRPRSRGSTRSPRRAGARRRARCPPCLASAEVGEERVPHDELGRGLAEHAAAEPEQRVGVRDERPHAARLEDEQRARELARRVCRERELRRAQQRVARRRRARGESTRVAPSCSGAAPSAAHQPGDHGRPRVKEQRGTAKPHPLGL